MPAELAALGSWRGRVAHPSLLDPVLHFCIRRPFLMQARMSYTAIGLFSVAAYPYSFKLLWSPIVDSVYSSRVGRCAGAGVVAGMGVATAGGWKVGRGPPMRHGAWARRPLRPHGSRTRQLTSTLPAGMHCCRCMLPSPWQSFPTLHPTLRCLQAAQLDPPPADRLRVAHALLWRLGRVAAGGRRCPCHHRLFLCPGDSGSHPGHCGGWLGADAAEQG